MDISAQGSPMPRTVSELGEKRIIRDLVKPIFRYSRAAAGVGDDAAVLSFPAGEQLVISTDKIPEDLLSIQLGLMNARDHGRYLAMVNISDIAAMGAKPLGLLCTVAIPNNFDLQYLEEFFAGFGEGGEEWNVPVVGGDTGWGSAVCMSASAFGSIEPGLALLRSGADVGDTIFVSGLIGGFGTALAYFVVAKQHGMRVDADSELWLKRRLIRPEARVATGRMLALSRQCTSCMDITDGVGQSLRELSEASNARLNISVKDLPLHPSTFAVAEFLGRPVEHLVFGIGLDLELVGSYKRGKSLPSELHPIGLVVPGSPGVFLTDNGIYKELNVPGWQHFAGSAMEIARNIYSRR